MTTDTDDEGFTTVHQSQSAFAGAGAGGVVTRPDLPITLSAAQAEILALRGRVARLEEALRINSQVLATWHPMHESAVPIEIARRALTNGGDNG